MTTDSETKTTVGLRWWRALGFALLAEVGLAVVAAPILLSVADALPIMEVVIPPIALVLFVLAGFWSARPVSQIGLMQGALTGAIAVALYVALGLSAKFAGSEADLSASLTFAYLLSHGLKIVGGALGGYWAKRRANVPGVVTEE